MPATLISMAKDVATDAGYSGQLTSVNVASGDGARFVKYVKDATAYIETLWGDWRFLWGGLLSGTLTIGQANIAAPTNLYRWDQGRLFFDTHLITPILWHEFQPYANMLDPGYPTQFVIMPDNSIQMYPPPDAAYNYQFSWYQYSRELNLDTDEPLIPDAFRRTITAYALWLYATYDDAAELAAKSQAEYNKWILLLEGDQRPDGMPSTQSSGNRITIVTE